MQFLNHYVIGLLKRLDEHHIFLAGAGIAFSLILSTIPILLLLFALLGKFIDPLTIQDNISKIITTMIPYPEYAEFIKIAILKRVPEVYQYSTTAFFLGVIGLFFTSTWIFSSMRTILNEIFGYDKTKGIIFGLLRDFGMVLLVIVMILVSTFVLPSINIFITATENLNFLVNFKVDKIVHAIYSLTSVIVVLFLFFLFYLLIPYSKLNKKAVFIGALWATIFWELARFLFGYYVENFLQTNQFYQAFLLVIVLLFWLFYASILFLVGAEIAQLYIERMKLGGDQTF
ncbi:MAG: YihY/virulence factor BrkB family protein [Ignavibacteriales bacterium]|nr:YihY/virulence factor BrkB family protein [Ignavibacteriales bacterium]MBK7980300.1 YihY/virulence factor BrkB family protein [Ignavibacteriota bacterium]